MKVVDITETFSKTVDQVDMENGEIYYITYEETEQEPYPSASIQDNNGLNINDPDLVEEILDAVNSYDNEVEEELLNQNIIELLG